MSITRREFVSTTAATVASLGWLRPLLARSAEGIETRPEDQRALVVIQLAGGNDGLNTVVPFADPLYKKLRPTIALAEAQMMKLDERLAFHAALAPLRERFAAGQVAVVEGVGYPKPDRSHFVSTAIWQTGRLEPYKEPTGWLGRAIDLDADPKRPRAHIPLEALGIGGGGLSPALYARTSLPSLLSLDAFTVQADRRFPGDAPAVRTALESVYSEGMDATLPAGFVQRVGKTALRSSDALKGAVAGYTSMVNYPQSGLANQLKLIAQILTANLGTRVFHVTHGGFDTHANQKPQQQALLGQLAEAITAFSDDLKAHGLGSRVAVMTYSEFGRRAQENGSAGTDHGAGNTAFVIGEKVKGGIYGPIPDLSKLEGGDVPFGVDFRTLYSSILREWLGVSADKVFGQTFDTLPLFSA